MIITQTPFRMSFFGGGTDYREFFLEHGGSVLSSTFDKFCYVTVRNMPAFFDYKNQITYGIIERTDTVEEIKHPAVREALKYMEMDKLRIVYEADLPARSGLGTSSSFAVGLLSALHSLKGEYSDKKQLADEAIHLERVLCGESGGIQDQIAVSYGGLNRIDFDSYGYTVNPIIISKERKQELNDNLMLFFTGFSRISSEIASAQAKETKNKINELLQMKQLVFDAERILTGDGCLDEFGRMLDYTWKLKRGITSKISNDSIDAIYKKAIENGARGGKLLGAGGGGFLLFYVEADKQQRVKEALSDLLYIPFNFENSGTRVMYYKPE